ncbi:unnamed protein product [Linum tenue]|uniref:Bet v I/Major latex protein domain-containing protein n=1 Tax=Linum tenue TaxID=586396 RepID=A0AAV0PA09_9ROSI|nr:unnamed protein product [Linum tenue]
MILEVDTLLPKLLPQVFKSIETIQGDGGPGSIKKLNFVEGKFVKHKIESLDKESMSMSYTVIEGDPMLAKAEAIAVELKVEAAADGGSKGEHITTVTPKPGVEVKAEEAMAGKGMAMAVLNAVDAYLVANPQAYA